MFKITVNALLVLFLFVFNAVAADATAKKISNLESTITNNESLHKYESYDAGTVSGSFDVKFTAMVVSDPVSSNVLATGMKVTILGDKNATSDVFLDSAEVQSLLNAIAVIKTISEKNATEKIEPYTEVLYASKGGFKFGYLNKGVGSGMFESGSSLFIRTPIMESILKNDEKRLGQMQTTISNALYKMSSK